MRAKTKELQTTSSAPSPPRYGSIHRDEVLPLREAARRMGWAQRMAAEVQRQGLPTVTIGRIKYTTGAAVYDFIAQRLAENGAQSNE